MPTPTPARAAAAAGGLAVLAVAATTLLVAGAGAGPAQASAGCGPAGTGQTVGPVRLDAEQVGNAQTITGVVAGRALGSYAAVIAVTTAYTESALRNSPVQTDHDSEGLFQQRVSIYTAAVAVDPVRATDAFLDRLVALPDWQHQPVGVDAQAVQRSAFPNRYQPNAALAQALVGLFWPAAAATAADPPPSPAPAVCAGGGAAGNIVGPTGNNVAGTTTIPAGLVLTGTPAGRQAVAYALAQLGKPYVWAAAGPDAYDCSGLTMAAWARAGVALPHSAAAQTASGTPEPTDLTHAIGGDLVMIPGADGTAQTPGHVGMVAGYVDTAAGQHLYLIQAPMTGIPVELTQASEWGGQVVDVRHIG